MKRYLLIIVALFLVTCTGSQVMTKEKSHKNAKSDNLEEELFEETGQSSQNEGTKREGPAYSTIARGYASWYGKELHGRPTASGEIFDMNEYTGAHRTYPMGSIVLVRNLENGKKRLVRINDRGPYVEGRIIDVSYAVARDLGFAEKGVAHVEVELIEEGKDNFLSKAQIDPNETSVEKDPTPEAIEAGDVDPDLVNSVEEDFDQIMQVNRPDYFFEDGKSPAGYTVRVGAFKVRVNAERYREELEDKYGSKVFIGTKGKWHFVWVGDFKTEEEARKFYDKLKTDGLDVMNPGKVH